MDSTAKHFVARTLAFHLVLLVMVIATVYLASREIYRSARYQAIDQARGRQEVLASQTARAVEGLYTSIRSALDLLDRAEKNVQGGALDFAPALWDQLEGTLSQLLFVDPNTHEVTQSFVQEGASSPQLVLGGEALEWLEGVTEPAISAFQSTDSRDEWITVVCVPVKSSGEVTTLVLGVVPMRGITARFLSDVNNQQAMNAMLVDENARVLGAPDPALIGSRLLDPNVDPRVASAAAEIFQQGKPQTKVFDQTIEFGGVEYESAMTTLHPIDLPQKKWWLVVSSSFAEVDRAVQTFFRRALVWGIFVIVAVTAILLSTSVQLIRGRMRLERERHEMLSRELTQAREIQLAWLPRAGSALRAMDIAAVNEPASHISGDFYNWFELPDGRTVITIGDVTGHGIAAAFLMATTQLLVRNTMLRVADPGQALDEVNRQLCVQVFNGQFVTMLIMVLDQDHRSVELANAGHQPPLISTGDRFEPLPIQPQLVLGVDDDVTFPTERFSIEPDSNMLLYTDGAIDVQSPSGDRYSTERLQSDLRGQYRDAQSILDAAIGAVNAFRGERELADDLTFVAIKLQPTRSRAPEVVSAT